MKDDESLSDWIDTLGMSEKNKGKIVPISKIPAIKVKEFVKKLRGKLLLHFAEEGGMPIETYSTLVEEILIQIFGKKLI